MIEAADRLTHVGEYFFSRKLKEIDILRQQGVDVINLGVGSPDLMPPELAIKAIEVASKGTENHGYQSYVGLPELRNAIASFYNRKYQIELDFKSEILPMMGSKEAIMHVSLAYLNQNDKVLIPSLGYPTYTSVTKLVGAQPIYYPLMEDNNWEPDWNFFESLNWKGIKLLWLNYPHMPTGATGSIEVMTRLVELAKKYDVLLCHDNPYSFILNEKPLSIFSVAGAKEVAIELNSLSKTFNMAGWRVGWVCGHADFLANILKVKSNMDSGMFKPVQLGAIEALNTSEEWFLANNIEYKDRQKLAFQLMTLIKATFSHQQAGMFVWGKISEDAASFSEKLLEETGVFMTPGIIFGEPGRFYIRISLCIKQERLKEAISRIEENFK
ncbi:MAG: aminotransferase class I/II-fold pyridoxal phosphate-dependent enzyme [Cyclobacteriaceae bacterium]